MAITDRHKVIFEAIRYGYNNDAIGLVECTHAETGQPIIVLCLMQEDEDGGVTSLPVARLLLDDRDMMEIVPPEGIEEIPPGPVN